MTRANKTTNQSMEMEDMPNEEKPRVLLDMSQKAERDLVEERRKLTSDRVAFERERAAERVHLNTQRDIRCYVMTAAELSSLIVADNLLIAIATFQSLTTVTALGAMVTHPDYTPTALAAAAIVVIGGSIGAVIGFRWRQSIIRAIRNGGRDEAQR